VKDAVPAQCGVLFEKLVQSFQSLRAAEVAPLNGYPLQAYTILRNVFDAALLASTAITEPLPVSPVFSQFKASIFIIRFCEVGWMVHRLIPLIQPPVIMFAPEWASDWRIIDDSFKITVNVANQKPWQAGWRGCLRVRVRQISLHRCINFPHALSGPVGSASRTSLMVSITPPIS
jgi:hypothetical protein